MGAYVSIGTRSGIEKEYFVLGQQKFDQNYKKWEKIKWAENKTHGQSIFLD